MARIGRQAWETAPKLWDVLRRRYAPFAGLRFTDLDRELRDQITLSVQDVLITISENLRAEMEQRVDRILLDRRSEMAFGFMRTLLSKSTVEADAQLASRAYALADLMLSKQELEFQLGSAADLTGTAWEQAASGLDEQAAAEFERYAATRLRGVEVRSASYGQLRVLRATWERGRSR